MKNHSPELPPVTYQEAIKLLNGLCEGLGDVVEENRRAGVPVKKWGLQKDAVSEFIWSSFIWSDCKMNVDWLVITKILEEIESGEGIKQ